jgi:hypothetical protein
VLAHAWSWDVIAPQFYLQQKKDNNVKEKHMEKSMHA